jgi:hypothetical protein
MVGLKRRALEERRRLVPRRTVVWPQARVARDRAAGLARHSDLPSLVTNESVCFTSLDSVFRSE